MTEPLRPSSMPFFGTVRKRTERRTTFAVYRVTTRDRSLNSCGLFDAKWQILASACQGVANHAHVAATKDCCGRIIQHVCLFPLGRVTRMQRSATKRNAIYCGGLL